MRWQGRYRSLMLALVVAGLLPNHVHAFAGKSPAPVEDSWDSHYPRQPQAPRPVTPGSLLLRVMTYNINGLPLPGTDHSRYSEVGRELKRQRAAGTAPHIVFLQEAFHDRTRELNAQAGYPHVAYGPEGAGVRMNAGLVILSEFPIAVSNGAIFTRCTSWDCFSRKGVQHARVSVPGVPQPLELFNTHMNSNVDSDFWTPEEDAQDARYLQSQEIRDFLWQVRLSQAPAVFGGDFNFRPGEWDYESFAAFIAMRNAAEDCGKRHRCAGHPDPLSHWRSAIDHVFFLGGVSPTVRSTPVRFEVQFNSSVGGRKLSDHDAQVAHFLLEW